MIDPEKNMLVGFFRKWKNKGRLGRFFIDESIKLVGAGFDQISGLESGKIKK